MGISKDIRFISTVVNLSIRNKPMINDFLVRAFPDQNQLKIILDGCFMKSELELAFHLAKEESKKLLPGYNILVDIKNMKTTWKEFGSGLSKLNRLFREAGGGRLQIMGIDYESWSSTLNNVGFYPYENAWLFH